MLDLTQLAHSLTEDEIFDETLVLLQQLTGSEIASLFELSRTAHSSSSLRDEQQARVATP